MVFLKENFLDGDVLYAGSILGGSGINAVDSRINQSIQAGYGNAAHGAFSLTANNNITLNRGQIYRYSTFTWVGPGSLNVDGQVGAPVVIMVSGNCVIGSNTLINLFGKGMPPGGGHNGDGLNSHMGWSSWSMHPNYPMLPMAGSTGTSTIIQGVSTTIYPNFFMPWYHVQGGGPGGGNDSATAGDGGGGGGAGIISAGSNGFKTPTVSNGTAGVGGSSNSLGGQVGAFSGLSRMRQLITLVGAGGGGGGGRTGIDGKDGGAGGGGIILLVGGELVFSGTVDLRGSGGVGGTTAACGGGGGGGLGLFLHEGVGINQGTSLITGGPGGSPVGGGSMGGSGGSGLFIFQQANGFML